ncbi:basic amino acid ABC transporter substrate-binding protein [uncultured Fusobacterium sp.]|uniref:basic amino acid ABC transporter substrate-binding protein n=1 Tax=uncultured Fusobacterium sp. TaxID=159267 RepID=UPI0015A6F5BC|nr:basic amino acid ABC transporter substrate-binding protein [uncultured Fusobacterium sp.]
MKKLVLLFMTFLSLVSFGKVEKLYVGTNAEFYPFEYLEDGKIVGFDAELIEAIGKKLNKEIIWKNMAFDGLLPALQSKKIDVIIAGMTATPERKKFVNFSDPYFVSNQMIIINTTDEKSKDITSYESLPNHSVGVVLGYTGDVAVSKLENIDVQRFNGASEAIMSLISKKVQAVVIDSEPAKNYVKNNKGLKLISTDIAKEEYSIAVSKENKKLAEDINSAYKELVNDGTFEKLITKYFK